MALYAGLDRSGTPDPIKRKPGREFYTICSAAVEVDLDELRSVFALVREQSGMSAEQEFKGHDDPEDVQLKVLHAARGMNLLVAASIYEKGDLLWVPSHHGNPNASQFQEFAALSLLERLFRRYQISKLWCDEDIKGKAKQQSFESAIAKLHRTAYPGVRIAVRHKSSNKSDLIQLADILGYGLSRLARGVVEKTELRRCLEEIWTDPRNIVEGPHPWSKIAEGDLRPYPRRG